MRADPDRTVARGRPHTVSKGMRSLPRGHIGYFVSPGAKSVIREKQRSSFISGDLKEVFRKMEILGISIEDITSLYQKYISKDKINQEQ